MEEDGDGPGVQELLRRHVSGRQHAPYYHWGDPEIEERGLLDAFLDPSIHKGVHGYVKGQQEKDDPPDAWVAGCEGQRVGLEMTELVSEPAVGLELKLRRKRTRRRKRSSPKSAEQDPSRSQRGKYEAERMQFASTDIFWERVTRTIRKKEKKCARRFEDGAGIELLIHSDECCVHAFIDQHLVSTPRLEHRFRAVWLILGYHPGKGCRLVRLL